MNSGDRAQRCLEAVSGWIREDVQRGGMGDKARMVGEGINYQAEGLYLRNRTDTRFLNWC